MSLCSDLSISYMISVAKDVSTRWFLGHVYHYYFMVLHGPSYLVTPSDCCIFFFAHYLFEGTLMTRIHLWLPTPHGNDAKDFTPRQCDKSPNCHGPRNSVDNCRFLGSRIYSIVITARNRTDPEVIASINLSDTLVGKVLWRLDLPNASFARSRGKVSIIHLISSNSVNRIVSS